MNLKERLNHQIYVISSCLIAIALPYIQQPGTKWVSFFAIVMSVNWLIEGKFLSKLKMIYQNPLLWLSFLLYGITIIGLFYTDDFRLGFRRLETRSVILLLPFLFGTLSQAISSKELQGILLCFVGSLLISTFWSLSFGISTLLNLGLYDRSAYFLMSRPYMGMYTALAIGILVYLIGRKFPIWLKMIFGILGVYLLFFMYILYAKMAILALGLSAFILIIAVLINQKRWLLLGLGFTFFTTFGAVLISQNTSLRQAFQKLIKLEKFSLDDDPLGLFTSANPRYLNWSCSWEVIHQDATTLWFGLGTGDAKPHLTACYRQRGLQLLHEYEYTFNAHNGYLQTVLSHGLIGLCILLAHLGFPLGLAFWQGKYLLAFFLLLFALCLLTESMLVRQSGVFFYSFFYAILVFQGLQLSIYKK